MSGEGTFVRAYYASWAPDSRARCLGVREELAGYRIDLCEIGTHADDWARTGMRTIPAFEVFVGGRPVRLLAGRVSSEAIRTVLERGATGDRATGRIEPLEIVSSTGCYRYDRWGEQFLTAYGRQAEGWS